MIYLKEEEYFSTMHETQMIEQLKKTYFHYINSLKVNNFDYRFSSNSNETSPFALCFALFGLKLLGKIDKSGIDKNECADKLMNNLHVYMDKRRMSSDLKYDKPFLQLLTFTLSCLSIIDRIHDQRLEEIIIPLITDDLRKYLDVTGALEGVPGSGNLAMFMAILLIHARKYMNFDTSDKLDQWVEMHFKAMNRFGFWGKGQGMNYLNFQNGYHQYEIFEYLGIDNPRISTAAEQTAMLSDSEGHFAPYPGGGGCYDYDAVNIITGDLNNLEKHKNILELTYSSILKEQNDDGGFCESKKIRPRKLLNIAETIKQVIALKNKSMNARFENLYMGITMLRTKNDRIHTHWSNYSRGWGESDLWDSWFRVLTLARIETAFNPEVFHGWGFIDYPGIGYHHLFGKSEHSIIQ